jgi:hypothetical protein
MFAFYAGNGQRCELVRRVQGVIVFAVSFVCLVLAILVLTAKKPDRPPYGSPEYRGDDRVVASVLVILAALFAAMH